MPFVSVGDGRMHYVERGAGEEVALFVHGWLSSHRWWLPVLDRLPPGVRGYAVDLRGAGESDPASGTHTLAGYAADLHAFAEALGLSSFLLVGHSMGGGVALRYALDHPERLKGLMLVNPLAPFGTRTDPQMDAWVRAQQGNPEGIRAMIQLAFATPPAPEVMETLVADALRWGPATYFDTLDDMARFHVVKRLPELQVPTLVLWGDRDVVIPFEGVATLFTRIPNCGLEVWHGVGHSPAHEAPDRLAALLGRFIEECRSTERRA
ncbi:AB hydrolase superfamily protein YdjP [Candidatus Thermoflexus japonica]|uniref:AB hydrolase superfamily protein YdjP n=1 Tax=Candidatus Thermoflexus japonica TaxID=2035417 RepID=A0A2H5Y545_9CHLR|nr:AB hydrolase superfamily protein YdjP [Candidatus Thermoflexus japonica]